MGILIVGFVFSCKTIGSASTVETVPRVSPAPDPAPIVAPSPAPEPSPSPGPSLSPEEVKILEDIYEQHIDTIILAGAKEYTVVWGDTLSKIARENYGAGSNAYYFPLIIAASKDSVEIVDPDMIKVGMKLTIPSLQENLNNPDARGNLKSLLKKIADFYSRKPGPQSAGLHNGLIRLYDAL
jgi:hypothetical protein